MNTNEEEDSKKVTLQSHKYFDTRFLPYRKTCFPRDQEGLLNHNGWALYVSAESIDQVLTCRTIQMENHPSHHQIQNYCQ